MANADVPELDEMLETVMRSQAARWHTSMPARVLSFEPGARPRAEVLPLLRAVDAQSGVAEDRTPVANVPVVFPQGQGARITWGLEAGDVVLVCFSGRGLTEWKSTPLDSVTPRQGRRFSLADAIAIPGLALADEDDPTTEIVLDGDGETVTVSAGGMSLELDGSAGTARLGSASVDVVDVLSQLLGLLSTATATNTVTAQVYPLTINAAAGVLKSTLDGIKA